MKKFIITEEEKKHIKSLYEQSNTKVDKAMDVYLNGLTYQDEATGNLFIQDNRPEKSYYEMSSDSDMKDVFKNSLLRVVLNKFNKKPPFDVTFITPEGNKTITIRGLNEQSSATVPQRPTNKSIEPPKPLNVNTTQTTNEKQVAGPFNSKRTGPISYYIYEKGGKYYIYQTNATQKTPKLFDGILWSNKGQGYPTQKEANDIINKELNKRPSLYEPESDEMSVE